MDCVCAWTLVGVATPVDGFRGDEVVVGEGGLGDVGDVDVGAGECRVVGSEALFESSGLGAGEGWVGDFFVAEEDVGVDFAELEAGVESVCVSLVVGGEEGEEGGLLDWENTGFGSELLNPVFETLGEGSCLRHALEVGKDAGSDTVATIEGAVASWHRFFVETAEHWLCEFRDEGVATVGSVCAAFDAAPGTEFRHHLLEEVRGRGATEAETTGEEGDDAPGAFAANEVEDVARGEAREGEGVGDAVEEVVED